MGFQKGTNLEAVTYIDSLNEYQQRSRKTASYPNLGTNLLYPALGLAGESGETVDKIKKLWRNLGITSGMDVKLTATDKVALLKELGDALWYIGAIASELDTNLSYVAGMNIDKLEDRKARGVTNGEGDNR